MKRSLSLLLPLAALAALAPSGAFAAEDAPQRPPKLALDRPLSLGAYGMGWAGAYPGAGFGGRLTWQPFRLFGLNLFGETLFVDSPAGLRHDHPIGFDLFVPWRLHDRVRIRPQAGMCAVFSLVDPAKKDGPRADDVLFGLHAGAGLDVAITRELTAFLDMKAVGYLGHDRAAFGWTGVVSDDLVTFGLAQAQIGVAVHVDP
jgi:hypothetical protein